MSKETGGDLKRVPTGIPGFDELVEGGLPINSSTLICGGPGTGKTIFCTEFLVNGAQEYKEKGLYVTFEQRANSLKEQARQFGWDLDQLEKDGFLKVISIPLGEITDKALQQIIYWVKKEGIKRLVIDSLSTLIINAPIYTSAADLSVKDIVGDNVFLSPPIIGDYIVKRFIYGFIEELRELDCTSMLISEVIHTDEYATRDTISEFVCDGVVFISFESLGGAYSRSLVVRKMRATKNNEEVHPVEISQKGIVVHKLE